MRRAIIAAAFASIAAVVSAAAQAPAVGGSASPAQALGGTRPTYVTDIPRTKDDKPDFSGVWQVMNGAASDVEPHQARKGVPAGMGVVVGDQIPYQPAALAKKRDNFAKRDALDPNSKCYLPGVPRLMYMPYPFQIFQTPARMTMLFEYVHATRYIYTNGTPHPAGHIDWWLGDSRGHWERDTFVIDNVDFNEDTWFDASGNFHSDALHVVERLTPIDADHITYDVTIEDPKVFTRPWRMTMIFYRHREPNLQLLEYDCYGFDNEFHAPQPTP